MLFKKEDDKMHLLAGMLISFITFLLSSFMFTLPISYGLSFIFGSLAGILKEVYDKYVKKTKFDSRDLLFTIIGALLSTILMALIKIL